jgi:serine protease inhibitor
MTSLVLCTSRNPEVESGLSTRDSAAVEVSNQFGCNLFKNIVERNPGYNVMISPLSVFMALGMTMNGASGETRAEMRSTLAFDDMSEGDINFSYRKIKDQFVGRDPGVTLNIANSIWTKLGVPVSSSYYEVSREYFDAETAELDFGDPKATDVINNWVPNATNGKITRILDLINPDDIMFLINAVYFHAVWTEEFDTLDTELRDFHPSVGHSFRNKRMYAHRSIPYYCGNGFEAIELAFGNGEFGMLFLLPYGGFKPVDLAAMLADPDQSGWPDSMVPQEIGVAVPRFTVDFDGRLDSCLQAMGMV